jgi:transposase-like protein
MICAASKPEIEAKRKTCICKWRVKCRAVAETLEEAGDKDKLFTFTRFPKSQWKSIRTSDEIDKRFASRRAIFPLRGRPRGEERGLGWKLRQVA